MWTYEQRTGILRGSNGIRVAQGYSGYHEGKDNPTMENVEGVGPIPKGFYTVGVPHDTDEHGPFVMSLTPAPANEMHGRSGFLMHGDSKEHPGEASRGCIIMPRFAREEVWNSGDHRLQVTEGS